MCAYDYGTVMYRPNAKDISGLEPPKSVQVEKKERKKIDEKIKLNRFSRTESFAASHDAKRPAKGETESR